MKSFSIAAIQMQISATHSNVELMKTKIELAMTIYPWIQMIVFSELAGYGPLTHNAQPFPGPFDEVMSYMANKHNIWLLPGSIFEQAPDGKIYNTATVYDPDGKIVTRYRKMFPFLPYEENVTSGSEFCTFDVPDVGRFGVSICYDMWFPETSRTLAVQGAEVILHPSLTGTIDRDIELSIARATAAMNQCFFFDVNGLGAGGYGKSIVCGPEGRVLYQAESIEEIIPIEIDIERVRQSREKGVLRLGQPLKSFRDHLGYFSIYTPGQRHEYLDSLGPLIKPHRIKHLSEVIKEGHLPENKV